MRIRRQSGFTLLEAIVTLVIVSLIVATLMQALAQSLQMRTRLIRYQAESRRAALQEGWFRDSVAGGLADAEEAFGGFRGSQDSFDMLTTAPLAGEGLARVRWSLAPVRGGTSLHYQDSLLGDLPVIAGPLRHAAFAYLDGDGHWHDRWVPVPDAAIPRAVRLSADDGSGPLLWIVSLQARPQLPENPHPEEVVGGL